VGTWLGFGRTTCRKEMETILPYLKILQEGSQKSTLVSLFLRKLLHNLKLKKYPFSVKIWYEHAALWVT
jgi:hypothetical protein